MALRDGRRLLSALAGAGLVACAPLAEEPTTATQPSALEAPGVPADVATVATVGWWMAGAAEGAYRLVIVEQGFDQIVSQVYLEWIELPPDGLPRIRARKDFDALNQVPLYKLDLADTRSDAAGLELILDARHAYTGERQRFEIRAGAPDDARLIAR